MRTRHVILDRDGVLNREGENGVWIHRPEDWIWERGALEGLRLLSEAGLRISIATNQSGVSRGFFSTHDVEAVHRHMLDEAERYGCRIDQVLTCPHAPGEDCDCRKPAPGLLLRAIEESGIGADETVLVGDAPRDLEAAEAAGIVPMLVRTGKGTETEHQLDRTDIAVFDDLLGAARAIVAGTDRGVDMSIQATFNEHAQVMVEAAEKLAEPLEQFIEMVASCLRAGHKILVCGNGGSAADAQHLAAELVCRFTLDRRALPAIALTTDTSALTAIGNDLGFDRIFARQVEALAEVGDVLVAISTSGRSPNVVEAAWSARDLGCRVVAMTGSDGGALADLADLVINAPSKNTARIQEVHGVALHIIAGAVEAMLAREAEP